MQEKMTPSGDQGRKRKPARKKKLWPLYLLLGFIAILLVIVAAFLPHSTPPPVRLPEMQYPGHSSDGQSVLPQEERSDHGRARLDEDFGPDGKQPSSRLMPPTTISSEPAAYRHVQRRGKLILIIDDVGNSVEELRPFLKFPGPLTLSIMPQRPYTLESYRMILGAGKTPMLHQPMEADGKQNPGAGAIYTSMSEKQVDSLLAKNLEGMPEITWVNNHEGSKATSNVDTMTYVLGYLKSRNIHFLDSRTSPVSAVKQASLRLGLEYFDRNSYFLDNIQDRKNIEKEIDRGLSVARKDGYAVMIGHVWDRELPQLLIEWYPRLVSEGYEFADIRSLVKEARNVGAGN